MIGVGLLGALPIIDAYRLARAHEVLGTASTAAGIGIGLTMTALGITACGLVARQGLSSWAWVAPASALWLVCFSWSHPRRGQDDAVESRLGVALLVTADSALLAGVAVVVVAALGRRSASSRRRSSRQ